MSLLGAPDEHKDYDQLYIVESMRRADKGVEGYAYYKGEKNGDSIYEVTLKDYEPEIMPYASIIIKQQMPIKYAEEIKRILEEELREKLRQKKNIKGGKRKSKRRAHKSRSRKQHKRRRTIRKHK